MFQRKQAFILLSSLASAWIILKFLCVHVPSDVHVLIIRKSCTAGMRNGILRNHFKSLLCTNEPMSVKLLPDMNLSYQQACSSCYHSCRQFDMQTRRKGQFCIVLTLLPRLYVFLNKGIFDSRLNSDNSYWLDGRVNESLVQ